MAKNKTQKIKRETYRSEEQEEIIRFVWILAIIIILILVVYFFTKIFVTKDLNKDTPSEPTAGEINYDSTLIGSMFTKPENEYFVLIYDSEDVRSVYYSGVISAYKKYNKEALRVYTADLNNELNKKYLDEENTNLNTNNLDKFKVGKLALLKIANKKVEKVYTTEEDIVKALDYDKDAK